MAEELATVKNELEETKTLLNQLLEETKTQLEQNILPSSSSGGLAAKLDRMQFAFGLGEVKSFHQVKQKKQALILETRVLQVELDALRSSKNAELTSMEQRMRDTILKCSELENKLLTSQESQLDSQAHLDKLNARILHLEGQLKAAQGEVSAMQTRLSQHSVLSSEHLNELLTQALEAKLELSDRVHSLSETCSSQTTSIETLTWRLAQASQATQVAQEGLDAQEALARKLQTAVGVLETQLQEQVKATEQANSDLALQTALAEERGADVTLLKTRTMELESSLSAQASALDTATAEKKASAASVARLRKQLAEAGAKAARDKSEQEAQWEQQRGGLSSQIAEQTENTLLALRRLLTDFKAPAKFSGSKRGAQAVEPTARQGEAAWQTKGSVDDREGKERGFKQTACLLPTYTTFDSHRPQQCRRRLYS